MKRLALTFAAIAIIATCSHAALADTINFQFTGSDFSGTGVLTVTAIGPYDGGEEYKVTGITGSVTHGSTTYTITGLDSSYSSPDNDIYDPGYTVGGHGPFDLDNAGISFDAKNGSSTVRVNLSLDGYSYDGLSSRWGDDGDSECITFTEGSVQDPPPAVPEPNSLALLATGLLGAAGTFRRRMGL